MIAEFWHYRRLLCKSVWIVSKTFTDLMSLRFSVKRDIRSSPKEKGHGKASAIASNGLAYAHAQAGLTAPRLSLNPPSRLRERLGAGASGASHLRTGPPPAPPASGRGELPSSPRLCVSARNLAWLSWRLGANQLFFGAASPAPPPPAVVPLTRKRSVFDSP
jgi:hypothetical protein